MNPQDLILNIPEGTEESMLPSIRSPREERVSSHSDFSLAGYQAILSNQDDFPFASGGFAWYLVKETFEWKHVTHPSRGDPMDGSLAQQYEP